MLRNLLLIGLAAIMIVAFSSCGDDNPTDSTNHAPAKATIDSTSGAPGDGAIGVSLTPVLQWQCTDADGDAITYTVYFGDSTTPPVVSASQTATSYAPDTLEYSKKYYWKISAKDASGATSNTNVFSFTTMAQPVAETISTPDIPTGPTSGLTGQAHTFSTGNAVSSAGHAVEYRFDWGDGLSEWSSATDSAHVWFVATSYSVKAQARCATHPAIESNWSAASASITLTHPIETIGTPDAPSGPATGETGESLTYSTNVVTSSASHSVEYYFDWGDGNNSGWIPGTSDSHSWSTSGPYDITVQARCATHNSVLSTISAVTAITITDPVETVTAPGAPSGPASGATNVEHIFSAFTAVSSLGHPIEYRFDLNDGPYSAWSSVDSIGHTYTAANTYNVAYQARCATHPSIESAWSSTHQIVVTDAGEIVTAPTYLNVGFDPIVVGSQMTLSAGLGTSDYSDSLEYMIDFGDGTVTGWLPTTWVGGFDWMASPNHTYTVSGTVDIKAKARCATHISVESGWSAPKSVVVNESISTPGTPTGPTTGTLAAIPTFTTTGSVSSDSHVLEYSYRYTSQVNFNIVHYESPWTTSLSDTPVLTSARGYRLWVRARCTVHTNILSSYSAYHDFTITAK